MDLKEAEDIKKRWQEYTEELYKKDLYDPDNHNGVITHLEPKLLFDLRIKFKVLHLDFTTSLDLVPSYLYPSLFPSPSPPAFLSY